VCDPDDALPDDLDLVMSAFGVQMYARGGASVLAEIPWGKILSHTEVPPESSSEMPTLMLNVDGFGEYELEAESFADILKAIEVSKVAVSTPGGVHCFTWEEPTPGELPDEVDIAASASNCCQFNNPRTLILANLNTHLLCWLLYN
jgi:hypothetical protein